jgi:membrane fusion protein, multidrug efflux system
MSNASLLRRRMVIVLITAGVIFGGIFGFEAFKKMMIGRAMAARGAPVQTVSTTTAKKESWQAELHAVGSFRAVNGAALSSEVDGIVEKIAFADGQDIAAGALLVQLRAEQDIATLRQFQAAADNAQVTYDRDLRQFKAQGVSQATIDNDRAAVKSSAAQVAAQQALVDKKSIRAPFAGRLGARQVDLGQYLAAGTAIVTLQALDPILFDFTLPQRALSQLQVGLPITATVDAHGTRSFAGKITTISPQVDIASRSLSIRGSFPNQDHALLPGMYGSVTIAVGPAQSYITLPVTAVTINPYGNVVFVVSENGKSPDGKPILVANQSFVTTGEQRGDQIAVLKGIEEGQTVVTTGQIKLQNGSPVTINNTVQPPDDPNAAPADPR